MRRLALPVFVVAAAAWVAPAAGVELGEPGELRTLEVHGFASQGFILTTANRYLAKSDDGSLEFAEAGLNFTIPVTDKLRVGMQLFTRDLGPIGDYRIVFDWFTLDYRWKDWLGLRAGRVKLPFGLYNDSSDIDAARTPVLLPQSTYPTENRDFLLAQTGVELYGYRGLGGLGALEYRLYAGTIFIDVADTPGSPLVVMDLTIPYVVGGRLLWEPPLEGLRLGGSVQALRLDGTLLDMTSGTPFSLEIPAILWVVSAEYVARDLLVALEYGRWDVDVQSGNDKLVPSGSMVSERAYAMLAYRLGPLLEAGTYYSMYYKDVEHRSGPAASQHDVALTLRFDLNSHWLLKLEGHFVHGTASLSTALNPPGTPLEPDWGLFLVKTTAYF